MRAVLAFALQPGHRTPTRAKLRTYYPLRKTPSERPHH
jgi:hypothetical protein